MHDFEGALRGQRPCFIFWKASETLLVKNFSYNKEFAFLKENKL